jgi:hypothetical protein
MVEHERAPAWTTAVGGEGRVEFASSITPAARVMVVRNEEASQFQLAYITLM